VTVAVVLHLCQQFCGINAVFYYSTDFFRGVISDPLMGSVLVCAINVVATLAATVLMDLVGRRTLMIVSTSGMIVATALVVSALLGFLPNFVALFAVMAFVGFFEVGLGPIPWLIVAEMFEPKYVAPAQSLACQVNWMCNFLVGVGFPFMQQALGPMSFLPFGAVLLGCLAFVSARMPETRGATLADVRYQVKVMWGIFDDLFKTQALNGDSVSFERSLAVYKQRVARRSGSNSSFEGGDGGPIML
jgi:SP family facilitated glucose transporter-like MFS transporter 3